MSKFRWLRLIAFLGSLVLMASVACGSTGDSGNSGQPLGTITLTGFQTSSYLPFWVLQAEKFDVRHGFSLRYINTAGGGTLYTPVATGRADATTILPPLAIQYATQGVVKPGSGPLVPVPAFWVKASSAHPATAIVARAGIDKISDLRGQVLATHDVVSGFFLQARTFLARDGLQIDTGDPASVRSVTMPFSAMGGALRNHVADAAILDYVTALEIAATGSGHILTSVLGAPPYDDYDMATFAFNREFLSTRPQAAVALLQATLDANDWILHNTQEAKRILLDNLQIPPASAANWIGGYQLDGFQTQFVVPLSRSTVPQDARDLLRWGMVDRAVDVAAIYEDDALVQTAQRGWHPSGS